MYECFLSRMVTLQVTFLKLFSLLEKLFSWHEKKKKDIWPLKRAIQDWSIRGGLKFAVIFINMMTGPIFPQLSLKFTDLSQKKLNSTIMKVNIRSLFLRQT